MNILRHPNTKRVYLPQTLIKELQRKMSANRKLSSQEDEIKQQIFTNLVNIITGFKNNKNNVWCLTTLGRQNENKMFSEKLKVEQGPPCSIQQEDINMYDKIKNTNIIYSQVANQPRERGKYKMYQFNRK